MSKTPETFEDTIRANGAQIQSKEYGPVLAFSDDAVAAILAAHTTALEAAKREARIDELESARAIAAHDNMMPDGGGIEDWCNDRIAQLSPNQPKQDGDEE